MSSRLQPEQAKSATLIFTQNAANKVWELMLEEGNLGLNLRVYISGGGCSGFQYGFTFDEEVSDDDFVVEQQVDVTALNTANMSDPDTASDDDGGTGTSGGHLEKVRLLVDAMSFQYLVGAEIDYKMDLEGERFIIRNPNAKTTCGCGSSFSI